MVAAGGISLAAAEMETRFYSLDSQRLDLLRTAALRQTGGLPAAHDDVHDGDGDGDDGDDDDDAHPWMEQLLRQWGVTFPPGGRVQWFGRQRKLIFHNTKENHRALEDVLCKYELEESPVLSGVYPGQDKAQVLGTNAERSEGDTTTKGAVLLSDMPTAGTDGNQAVEVVIAVWRGMHRGHYRRDIAVLFFDRAGKLVDWHIKRERPTVP